jgi:hypothetical protein
VRRSLFLLALGAAFVPAAARADSIDGHWCSNDGRHVEIRGSAIETPPGTVISGDYSRHGFAFVMPAPDPGAGQQVRMQLVSDELVRWSQADRTPETWRRCLPKVS